VAAHKKPLIVPDVTKDERYIEGVKGKIRAGSADDRRGKLVGILENASDAIFNVDQEGRFTFFNRAAGVISGYRREEILGRPFTDLLSQEYRQEMSALLKQGVGAEPGHTYEVEFLDKWGGKDPLGIEYHHP